MTDEPKKIVIDMAGVMEKLTPEMFDAAKDAMIEALIKGGTEWRNRAEAAEAKLAALEPSPEVAGLVEALENIARQKRTDELVTVVDVEYADFEGAYDTCIDVARATLAAYRASMGDAK